MAVFAATRANIPAIRRLLAEAPQPPYETAASIAGHLDDPAISLFFDDTLDAFCWVAASEQRPRLTIVWLWPRLARADLLPLLHAAIADAVQRHGAEDWEVTATFQDGRDAEGVADKGRADGQAWKAVVSALRQRYRGDVDLHEIYGTARDVLAGLEQARGP